MELRETFVSKVALAALTMSLAQVPSAWAAAEVSAPLSHSPETVQTNAPQKPGVVIAPEKQGEARLTKTWSVTADPVVPVGVILALGGLYGVFCLMAARRRMKGAWLRVGAGGVLVLTLVNPQVLHELREPLSTEVAVVIDKSASQQLDGRGAMTDAAYAELLIKLSGIEGVNVRTIQVGGQRSGAAIEGTPLFGALDSGLADIPPDRLGAVIVLTDGQVHDVPADDKDRLMAPGVPLHVLVSGREGEYDRRIVIDQAPRFGLVGQGQKIVFRVLDEGAAGTATTTGGKVRVSVNVDGREIAVRDVVPGEPVEMSLDIPHTGSNIVELKAQALAGELTDVNNRIVTSIEGIRENLNVLLISGEPDAGVRMWRDVFKSDPGTNLVHFTILRPPEKQDYTPLRELSLIPFPTQELFTEKIGKFDLVVFDHYRNDGFLPPSYFNNIARHVKEGGALLVISGPDFEGAGSLYKTPLGPLLPAIPAGGVTQTPYAPQLSDAGKRHPVTRGLAGSDTDPPRWGRWAQLADSKNVSGTVVMEGPGKKPLLILGRAEKGRVAMLQSDSAWLWARGYEGGGPYADLARQVSRWLVKDPALEEESLRMTRQGGMIVIEQQTMADKNAPVTVHTPSGRTVMVTPEAAGPGLWRATIPADEMGLYSAEQEGQKASSAIVSVGPADPKEFVHTISTTEVLKPAAAKMGGGVARMAAIGDAKTGGVFVPRLVPQKADEARKGMSGADWMGIRMTEASILKSAERKPFIPGWVGFLLVAGLLAGAWYREGDGPLFRRKQKPATPDNASDNVPRPPEMK